MTIATPSERADAEPAEGACAQCGAPLADDQEWCLECGGARTLIHRPRDWRIPVAIIGLVVAAAALAAFVVVLVKLSNDANQRAARAAATAQAAKTPPAAPAAPAPASTGTNPATPPLSTPNGTRLEVWPPGLSGWTVVLTTTGTAAQASTTAQQIASNGLQVGILDSSQHPRVAPGGWIVFTGRYPTQAQAEQAVTALQAIGQQQAVARLVGRRGN